jgi:hypothetical protein
MMSESSCKSQRMLMNALDRRRPIGIMRWLKYNHRWNDKTVPTIDTFLVDMFGLFKSGNLMEERNKPLLKAHWLELEMVARKVAEQVIERGFALKPSIELRWQDIAKEAKREADKFTTAGEGESSLVKRVVGRRRYRPLLRRLYDCEFVARDEAIALCKAQMAHPDAALRELTARSYVVEHDGALTLGWVLRKCIDENVAAIYPANERCYRYLAKKPESSNNRV